jgi:hypothetical protein
MELDVEALRKKLTQQAADAIQAGNLDAAQSHISSLKRLDIAAKEIQSILDSPAASAPVAASKVTASASTVSAPGSGSGGVSSALVRVSGGDLRRNLFRLSDARRHGMLLPTGPATVDLIGAGGTKTIQTEVMDYKFRARREFGKLYAELHLNPDDQLLLEGLGNSHFRVRKP